MYIPKDFNVTDFEKIKQFIQTCTLGTIFAYDEQGSQKISQICPLPLIWQDDGSEFGVLIGHVAKVNPIYKIFSTIANATTWQVQFLDNGQYISPNWYPSKALTHKEVPTWNYQAVQFTVMPTWVLERDGVAQIISDMTDFFEAKMQTFDPTHQPWSLTDAPSEYVDAMCRAIVGIKMPIVSIEAKFKLSQNKSAENQQGVIDSLYKIGNSQALAMVELIENLGNS